MKGTATKLYEAVNLSEYIKGGHCLEPTYLQNSWLSATACITEPVVSLK